MNIRHQAFADEYLANGMNASKAYTKIYQSKESVSETNGSKLLRNTQVLAYIQTKTKLTSDNLGITRESLLKQLDETIAMAKLAGYSGKNQLSVIVKAIEV